MHLNKPLPEQYFYWLRDTLKGDFGLSLVTQRPVTSDVREFLPASLELVIMAAVISSIAGIGLGIISARYKDTWIDNVVRIFSYAGCVTPSFVFAILFVLLFEFTLDSFPIIGRLSDNLTRQPASGMVTVDFLIAGRTDVFTNAIWHMVLPAMALAMGSIAQAARITRSSMADNISKESNRHGASLGHPGNKS